MPLSRLASLLANNAAQPVDRSLAPLIEAVQQRFCDHPLADNVPSGGARGTNNIQAILFYGSCMRQNSSPRGIADIYVLVDSYRHCYRHRPMAWANAWLPPNVFMLKAADTDPQRQQHEDDRPPSQQLAKCAVLTLEDFEAGLRRWFHSYLWGRFAQPCRLVYQRDAHIAERIHQARAEAVTRLLSATVPLMPTTFTASTLWQQALACCYATELRPERQGRAAELADHDAALYQQLTEALAIPGLRRDGQAFSYATDARVRGQAKRAWWWRRRVGRTLNVLRLIKAAFTFSGGIDYLLWKLERHTGTPIAASERLRRHPLIFGWPLLWRLWREGRLG